MTHKSIDIEKIREDFPGLRQDIYDQTPLIYFDNAATTQRPQQVLHAMHDAYTYRNANIHRGVHKLSQEATTAHEEARNYVAQFIGARESAEVLFTSGTTESVNLVAATFVPSQMKAGDEIIITEMEHHANIVPWQMAKTSYGIEIKVIPITEEGDLDLQFFEEAFSPRTKLVSVCYASNVLGTVNPIKEMTTIAHKHGVPIFVDAAQAITHRPINVQELDVDFLAFSGHKIYGPTGIGVLYGKRAWLEQLPPYKGGGEMIERVSFSHTTFNVIPFKFEAGTPDFIGSVGLHAALKYLSNIGWEAIEAHEQALLQYTTQRLSEIEGIRFIGNAKKKEALISFLVGDIHPYDLGVLLDRKGIAIRTGHHCAQPLMEKLNIAGTARISFAIYNTKTEIDQLMEILPRAVRILEF